MAEDFRAKVTAELDTAAECFSEREAKAED